MEKDEKGKNSVFLPVIVGIILIVAFVLLLFLPSKETPGRSHYRGSNKRINCASNLKQIGLALKQYSMDYDDCFPPQNGVDGLELLRKDYYLTDYKIYTCPDAKIIPCTSGPLIDSMVAYVYRGGLTETDSADSAICWDKPNNHKNYGNILFIDGHVQGFSGPNWIDNIK